MSVGLLVHRGIKLSVEKYPEKTALIYKNNRITYSELDSRANRIANSIKDMGLMKGDKILAVDGTPVSKGYHLLAHLQNRKMHFMVERKKDRGPMLSVSEADSELVNIFADVDLKNLINEFTFGGPEKSFGDVYLLNSVSPIKRKDLMNPTEIGN